MRLIVKKGSTRVRTPGCHSRESGNPWGTSLSGALVSFEDGCPARAKWIPAFAGMTRKCWVRIAHAALTSVDMVGLMSRHRVNGAGSRRIIERVRITHDSSHTEL